MTRTAEIRKFVNSVMKATRTSQKKLAQEAGVTQPWLSQMLNGRRVQLSESLLGNLRVALIAIVKRHGLDRPTEADINLLFPVGDQQQGEPFDLVAIKAMVTAGLLACGLGLTSEQVQEFVQRPRLNERVSSTLKIFRSLHASMAEFDKSEGQ